MESLRWAEEDGADWDRFLKAEPDPLRRELARIGLHGLRRRYGFSHGDRAESFELIFGAQDLTGMPLPDGVPAPPQPERSAGEAVRITVRPVQERPWNGYQGLRLRWVGDGDRDARRRFRDALAAWLAGFLAMFSSQSEATPPRAASDAVAV